MLDEREVPVTKAGCIELFCGHSHKCGYLSQFFLDNLWLKLLTACMVSYAAFIFNARPNEGAYGGQFNSDFSAPMLIISTVGQHRFRITSGFLKLF